MRFEKFSRITRNPKDLEGLSNAQYVNILYVFMFIVVKNKAKMYYNLLSNSNNKKIISTIINRLSAVQVVVSLALDPTD
jgi:hypothetical protein